MLPNGTAAATAINQRQQTPQAQTTRQSPSRGQHLTRAMQLRQYMDDEQFRLFEQTSEFTKEFREACESIKKVEKEITKELQKQVDISRKPEELAEMYTDKLQPMNIVRKKLWYRLYKYWHEPFIEKNFDDDKLLLLKQQNAYKKRMKKRQQEKRLSLLQKNKKSTKISQNFDSLAKKDDAQNDSDSVDLEQIISEQKKLKNENEESNITAEFMNEEDDADNDEMAQIISKKVDPFNINHKKNQNLYRDTLLECIGLKPRKLVKNIALPQFYVRQHQKQRRAQLQMKNAYGEYIQVCEPNRKKAKETKELIKENIDEYLNTIEHGLFQKLSYLKPLNTVRQEELSKSRRLNGEIGMQFSSKGGKNVQQQKIIMMDKVIKPEDYEDAFNVKKKSIQPSDNIPYTIEEIKFLSPDKGKPIKKNERRGSFTQRNNWNIQSAQKLPYGKTPQPTSPRYNGNKGGMITPRQHNVKIEGGFTQAHQQLNISPQVVKEQMELKIPKYALFNDKPSQFKLRKFYERIEKSSWKTQNNLAFQNSRSNRINYPCLSTQTLIEKASEALKSKVAQAKIVKINKTNQQEWIDSDLKSERLQRIADGHIELEYDLEINRQKYINQVIEELDSQDESAIKAALNQSASDSELSLKDFQAIAKDIKQQRLKSKQSPMKRVNQISQLTTRRQSIDARNNGRQVITPQAEPLSRMSIFSAQQSREGAGKYQIPAFRETLSSAQSSTRWMRKSTSNKVLVQNDNVKKAQDLFQECKDVLHDGSKLHFTIKDRESKISKNFDDIRDRVTHNILLGDDDIKTSVEDFHNKKHIFIYNKDLSKGYFIRVDPMHINEIARRLHTFKFKEPRIVAEEDEEAEKIEKQRLQKYFHKRFRSEMDANALKPKYTEKFISKVQAVTEMCNLKLQQRFEVKKR